MQRLFFMQKTMVTVNILKWAVFTLFPIVTTVPIPPFAPRPLCNLQLALANQACAYLPASLPPPPPSPFAPVRPPPPPPPEYHQQIHSHSHSYRYKHDHSHGHDQEHEHGQNQSHVHRHSHNQSDEHQHGHDQDHDHHKHGHGHHKHRMSPVEQQCCKWLAQVDDECVCELLGHLPPFLARPIHEYTVRVAGSCNKTYLCGAQFRL